MTATPVVPDAAIAADARHGASDAARPSGVLRAADYVASLARDTTLTQVSALLLHYANIAIGIGMLAAPSLVRGRRGRLATSIGALLAVVGFVNVSGQILADWWNMSAGRLLPLDQ